jgi:hypothetical protein
VPGFPGRRLARGGGLGVGAGDVAAAGDAAVEAGSVFHGVAVAQGLVSLVVADDEGVGVVVDHGVLVLQQLAGGGERDGDAGEPGRGGCGRDRAAGGGAGDGPAVVKVWLRRSPLKWESVAGGVVNRVQHRIVT